MAVFSTWPSSNLVQDWIQQNISTVERTAICTETDTLSDYNFDFPACNALAKGIIVYLENALLLWVAVLQAKQLTS